jgi:hypothetical protein
MSYDPIIATLPDKGPQNGRDLQHDKEMTHAYSVVAYVDGELSELLSCRCWMGRSRSASTVYASVWLRAAPYGAGHGKASGYGYCKTSAAIDAALRSAGVQLSRSVSGTGEHKDALLAVGRALVGADAPVMLVEH